MSVNFQPTALNWQLLTLSFELYSESAVWRMLGAPLVFSDQAVRVNIFVIGAVLSMAFGSRPLGLKLLTLKVLV